MLTVFDTAGVAPGLREKAFGEAVRAAVGSIEVDALREPFEGRIELSTLGSGRMLGVEGTAQRVRRRPRADALAETMKVIVQQRGDCRFEHAGRVATLRAGELLIVDGRSAFELEIDGPFRQIVLLLPRELARSRVPNIERAAGRSSSLNSPADRFVAAHLGLVASAADDSLPAQAPLVDGVLASLGMASTFDDGEPTSRVVGRALSLIDLHLHDASFDPPALVDLLRAGRRRTVEKAFAAQGTTITRELWRRRVERARTLLKSPRHANRAILEIALACGFTSAPHFARVFRAHLGLSPRAFRAN